MTDDADVCTKPDSPSAPASTDTAREPDGRWKRGKSPNPGGKTKAERNLMLEIRELAGRNAPAAIRKLRSIMDNRRAPYQAQIAAASAILDRAVGKPAVPPSATRDDGTPAIDLEDFTVLDRARRIAYMLGQGLRAMRAMEGGSTLIEGPPSGAMAKEDTE